MATDIISFLSAYGVAAAFAVVAGYLIGSISFAILITGSFEKKDIRNFGSGNAGMTNVFRSVGKRAGFLTFLGDFAKGVISALVGMAIFILADSGFSFSALLHPTAVLGSVDWKLGGYIAGLFCVIGHMFPLYHEFKGGKGVLTAASVIAVTDWRVLLIELAVFLVVFLIFKIVSLASISCAVAYPIVQFLVSYFLDYKSGADVYTQSYWIISTIIALIVGVGVSVKHHENIKRLINGTEKKFAVKKR